MSYPDHFIFPMSKKTPPSTPEKGISSEQLLEKFAARISGFSQDKVLVKALTSIVLTRLAAVCADLGNGDNQPFPLTHPKDLFELCTVVDVELEKPGQKGKLAKPVSDAIAIIRRDLSKQIIAEMFTEDPSDYGDAEAFRKRQYQEQLANLAGKIVAFANTRSRDQITPQLIKTHKPALYRDLITLFYQQNETEWTPLLRMLPEELNKRCEFNIVELQKDIEKRREAVEQFKEKFKSWGGTGIEEDLFVLEHPGVVTNLTQAQNILRNYLGTTHPAGLGGDPSVLPPAILHPANADLLRIVELLFRRQVYGRLVEMHDLPLRNGDLPVNSPDCLLEICQATIADFCNQEKKKGKKEPEENELVKKFTEDTMKMFEEILRIEAPARLKGVVIPKDGRGHRKGIDLRQKVAMYDVLHLKDHDKDLCGKLIAFFMGKGKTLTSFLIYEALRDAGKFVDPKTKERKKNTKMLYICPPGALPQQVKNQVREHYKDGEAPSVGIIDSDVQSSDLPFIFRNEIVIIPYSMLSAQRNDHSSKTRKTLVQFVNEAGFDLVVQDEPQNANKPNQSHTKSVNEVMKGCGAHCFVQLSGNPFPNSPADAIAQLALARPDLYRNPEDEHDPTNPGKSDTVALHQLIERQKKNPRLVRAALHEFILCLDDPEDWERYIRTHTISLSPRERRYYDAILQEDKTPSEKIDELIMCIMNPGLRIPDATEHSFADATGDVLHRYLEEPPKRKEECEESGRSVVMVESLRRFGILEPEEGEADVPRKDRSSSFYELVQDQVLRKMAEKHGPGYVSDVDFQVLHGDTPQDERSFLLLRSQYPDMLPTLKLFQLTTELVKKRKDYTVKIAESKKRSQDSTEDLERIAKDRHFTPHDHDHVGRLCVLMGTVNTLSIEMVGKMETLQRCQERMRENPESKKERVEKAQAGLDAFVLDHPEIAGDVEYFKGMQQNVEGYVVTEPEVFERILEVFLGQDPELSEWLAERDQTQELKEACEKNVISGQSLTSLKSGLASTERNYSRELREFLGANFPQDGVDQHKRFRLELEGLAGEADGNLKNFLDEANKNPEMKSWLEQMEREYPEKKKRFVLFVMRQIIAEGIDLSRVERVILTTPNWIKPAEAQAVKRFDRNGKEVDITRMQVSDSIFEGIAAHAENKMRLVMKLLYGGAFTEEERRYIANGDFDTEMKGTFYLAPHIMALLTPRQRLGKYIGYLEGQGAEELQRFLLKHGGAYARAFCEQWETSYSINNARFVSAMIEQMKEEDVLQSAEKALKVLDCGCGPLVLENTFGLSCTRRNLKITSVDMNQHLLDAGHTLLEGRRDKDDTHTPHQVINGSMVKVDCPDTSFDLVNTSLSFNYLDRRSSSKDPEKQERAQFLSDKNRLLKEGGVLLLTLPCAVCPRESFDAFCSAMRYFGFEVLSQYTGMGKSSDHTSGEDDFENWVLACKKIGPVDDSIPEGILKDLKFSRERRARGGREEGSKKPKVKKDPEVQEMHHNSFTVEGGMPLVYKEKIPDAVINKEVEATRAKLKAARKAIDEAIALHGNKYEKWDTTPLRELKITYTFNPPTSKRAASKLTPEDFYKRIKLVFLEGDVRLGGKQYTMFAEDDVIEVEEEEEEEEDDENVEEKS